MVNNFLLAFSLSLPFSEVNALLSVILCTASIISSACETICSSGADSYHISNLPRLFIWFSLKPKPFYIVLGISEDYEVGENCILIHCRVATWSQSAFKWPWSCQWENLLAVCINITSSAVWLFESIFLNPCFCYFCFSTMQVWFLLIWFTA